MTDTYGYGERLNESLDLMRKAMHSAITKYLAKENEYGDSWRDATIPFLLDRLSGEIKEVNYLIQAEAQTWDYNKLSGELKNVINIASMLVVRFEEEKE